METMWYYVQNGTAKLGPVPESELKSLVASGQVQPADLVWSEGMEDWMAYSSIPALSGLVQPAAAPAGVAMAAAPMAGAYGAAPAAALGGYPVPGGLRGWLMFLGVMNIIGGVFAMLFALICFVMSLSQGLLLLLGGVMYIVMGCLVLFAGTALTGARNALLQVTQIDAGTELFMSKIKRYMVIQGSMIIFGVVMTVVVVIEAIVFGVAAAGQFM